MSNWVWIPILWVMCGGVSMLVTKDLEGPPWGKPLLFAMGPFGLFIVMIAATRY